MIKQNALWLSPMESVSDLGFRKICFDRGADMTFTEMIRADALIRKNKEIPTGLQLLVSKPQTLQKVLLMITKKIAQGDKKFCNINGIDLNFGCPSEDVITQGAGPALLKRTTRMRDLLTTLKEFSPVPCGIKIRLGMNLREKQSKVYMKIVEIANEIGLDWLTVHAKTADQDSGEPLDMRALQEIIDASKVPVIASGFVIDGPHAKIFLDMGCRGVMIARAAIVNPWIFEEIKQFLKTGKIVTIEKNYAVALEEYKKIAREYGTKDKFKLYHKATFKQHITGDFAYHSPNTLRRWN
jgi:tRNA-dihydrouridine synthase B